MDIESLRLVFLTDASGRGESETLRCASALAQCRPGRLLVVLRDRSLPLRRRLKLGKQLRELTASYGQLLSVVDRFDLALLLRADGLHLGGRAPSALRIRGRWGQRAPLLITAAWHVDQAFPRGCDLALLSPVVEGRKGRSPIGWQGLKKRAEQHSGAIVALGGVGAEHLPRCWEAGAQAAAVMGAAYEQTQAVSTALARC